MRRLVTEHLEANPAFKSFVLVDGTRNAKRRLDEALYGRDRVIFTTIQSRDGLAGGLSDALHIDKGDDIQSVGRRISSALELLPDNDKKPAVVVVDLVDRDEYDTTRVLKDIPHIKQSMGKKLVVLACVPSADCLSSLPLATRDDLVVHDCQSTGETVNTLVVRSSPTTQEL